MGPKSKGTKPTPVETFQIVRDGQEYTEVREGLARILAPVSAEDSKADEEQQKVFYNPIQQFNRDLTVLAIKAYGEELVAKRKQILEKRFSKNRNKRKRTDAEDERPQKQGKSEAGVNNEAAPASVGEAQTASGDLMNTSEPLDGEQSLRAQDNTDAVTDAQTSSVTAPAEPSVADLNTETKPVDDSRESNIEPPHFTILDALSATGLRALRYVQELPFVTSVTANDLSASAVEAIKLNAVHNDVFDKINATQGDALAHMYSVIAEELSREHAQKHPRARRAAPSKKYDVIDLDPYGTAATFFDAAVQVVHDDGGLLCVTCTDSGVWATHGYSEKAFALYGGIPVKGFHSHEAGLRLILNAIATAAGRHGLAIEPLLSLSIDYYVRIFVRVKKSPASVKFLAGKTMIVYSCDQGCGAWETQMLLRNRKMSNAKGSGHFYKHGLMAAPTADQFCKHCGSKMHLSGPMYGGPIHSSDFIKRILNELPDASKDVYGTKARIEGMLHTALEETTLPPPPSNQASIKEDELAAIEPYPFFFHPVMLSGAVHCECPDEESFRGALRGLGYEVVRSHCKPGSLKTNAPWPVIWHVMREWVRQKKPVKVENIKPNSAAYKLLRLDQRKPKENTDEDATGVAGKEDKTRVDKIKGAEIEAEANKNGETIASQNECNDVDKLTVVFNKALGQDKSKKGLIRYQMNPKENWGPLAKAKKH